MAWSIVARVMKTKVGSASGKAILLALANHCDESGGNCYPGQEVIQALTELSLDTIQRQIESLVSGGFVTRKKRPAVRGRWASWSYQIDLSKLADQAALCGTVDHTASCGSVAADQAAPCGVTEPHHAVSPSRTMRLKPVLKPFNKPSRAKAPSSPDGLGALGAPLRNRIGREKFDAWFGGAVIAGSTADSVTVEFPTKFRASHVERNFEADVLACCQAQQSTIERVRFTARAA
jgi:Helix-turn-helix domain